MYQLDSMDSSNGLSSVWKRPESAPSTTVPQDSLHTSVSEETGCQAYEGIGEGPRASPIPSADHDSLMYSCDLLEMFIMPTFLLLIPPTTFSFPLPPTTHGTSVPSEAMY